MNEIRTVELQSIRLRNRIRKDMGDIQQLKDSLKDHGLLNPVVITADLYLIAGQRRLEAARQLGWQSIQCRVIDLDNEEALLEIEIAENAARKDFSSDEMADALVRLDHLRNPNWFKKFWRRIARFFKRLRDRFRRRQKPHSN